jgi:hypothetical protein
MAVRLDNVAISKKLPMVIAGLAAIAAATAVERPISARLIAQPRNRRHC